MPTEHKSYFFANPQLLLLTTDAFKSIETHIDSAVVRKERDIVSLNFSCHQRVTDHNSIIRNGKQVSERESCLSCSQRLRQLVGTCNSNYLPFTKPKANDLTYLIERLNTLGCKEDVELHTYFLTLQQQADHAENNINDMDFREYVSLIAFFERISILIDYFHQRNFVFRKLFVRNHLR